MSLIEFKLAHIPAPISIDHLAASMHHIMPKLALIVVLGRPHELTNALSESILKLTEV
jgi:hypothetical protein